MDPTMDTYVKDCDALGGLFQSIVSDLKGGSPVWEDFIGKATKFSVVLRTTALATGVFLDAFQKVADLANNSRGATREIGAALTRLCIRHRSIENKLKTFASAITDQLVEPLQGKMDDWKKTAVTMDKEHSKEYKKAQQEIKKASQDLSRLKKRANKGRSDAQQKLDQVMNDINGRYQRLENAEKAAVRTVMIEERNHFCFFFNCFKPLLDVELSMLQEVTHLQEIIDILSGQTADPNLFPASSEQVIIDLKGTATETTWTYRTPPSSPMLAQSQLGSRKSSMCSVSSESSGSTRVSLQSPSHGHLVAPPLTPSLSTNNVQAQCARQLSSVSSQDSGFVSHDLTSTDHGSVLDAFPKNLVSSEIAETASISSDSVAASVSSWSGSSTDLKHSSSGPTVCPHAASLSVLDRPHTISSSYEHSHSRPSLTMQTFEPPPALPVIRSRPVSSMIYAVPNAVTPSRTADIYARPVLCGRRVPGIGPQPVVPPTAPSEYAVCGHLAPTTDNDLLEEKEIDDSNLHRCSSFPAQTSEAMKCNEENNDSNEASDDNLFLHHRRRLLLNDDNYIMNTVSLCDAHKQMPCHDFESLMDIARCKRPSLGDFGKSMTLPRNCLPFKLPEFPQRTTSVIGEPTSLLRCSFASNNSCNRVKPPPPARRNSVKSEYISPSTINEIPKIDEVAFCAGHDDGDERNDAQISDACHQQPKQQAPPIDDTDSLWLPPPPSAVSCTVIDGDAAVAEWLPTEPEPVPTASTVSNTAESIPFNETSNDLSQHSFRCASSPEGSEVVDVQQMAVSNSGILETDIDMPADPDMENSNSGTSMLDMIRHGVTLRRTVSNDRSAPRLSSSSSSC